MRLICVPLLDCYNFQIEHISCLLLNRVICHKPSLNYADHPHWQMDVSILLVYIDGST